MSEHVGLIDGAALRRYVDRIVTLREDRKAINDAMAAVFGEAKEAGFVPAIIRRVAREMEMEEEARATFFATQDTYRRALGLLADTPLGEAAIEREATVGRATAGRPRPFAEQPLHRGRGRPRKPDLVDDMIRTASRTRRPRKADRVEATLADIDPVGAAE